MPLRTSYRQGTPNWVDLQTTDQAAAKAFYGGLFGWSYDDQPMPDTYIAVDSVDDTVTKVQAAGGQVAMPPFDVMDAGRMAFVLDPGGAAVAFWQAGQHIGAELVNEPGTFTWNELITADPSSVAF